MQMCLPVLTFAKCFICVIKWVTCIIVILSMKRCIFVVQTEKCHGQEQNPVDVAKMYIIYMVLILNGITIKTD